MKILISGAGIAGPTLAYWLARAGFTPVLVEKAPRLRSGGYIIDFWGAGFEIAGRMGLIPELHRAGFVAQDVRVVNSEGKRIAGFPVSAFVRMTKGRYVSLPRGDLAAAIFRHIEGSVETIFGDSVAAIEEGPAGVRVTFESGRAGDFDLVAGADGLHSRVRELVFGAEANFEKYLGVKAAAFEAAGYRPRDELAYVMHTEVGRQISRVAMGGDRTMFLLTWADADPRLPRDAGSQKAVLRREFGNCGWEGPAILRALDAAEELYFDRVSQIRMDGWTRGRVTLLGDAASCVSLLAGEGSSLAMAGAYLLAWELRRAAPDYASALARFRERFLPLVEKKQKSALRFAGFFAPESRTSLWLRNQVMNLLKIGWIADLAVGRDLADHTELPEWE
jgi:2-polyprenyl-6-methoxyphenol hydroxylase-like FAD-dependent oxidoreductase